MILVPQTNVVRGDECPEPVPGPVPALVQKQHAECFVRGRHGKCLRDQHNKWSRFA
jgi:hypothetical protein